MIAPSTFQFAQKREMNEEVKSENEREREPVQ